MHHRVQPLQNRRRFNTTRRVPQHSRHTINTVAIPHTTNSIGWNTSHQTNNLMPPHLQQANHRRTDQPARPAHRNTQPSPCAQHTRQRVKICARRRVPIREHPFQLLPDSTAPQHAPNQPARRRIFDLINQPTPAHTRNFSFFKGMHMPPKRERPSDLRIHKPTTNNTLSVFSDPTQTNTGRNTHTQRHPSPVRQRRISTAAAADTADLDALHPHTFPRRRQPRQRPGPIVVRVHHAGRVRQLTHRSKPHRPHRSAPGSAAHRR